MTTWRALARRLNRRRQTVRRQLTPFGWQLLAWLTFGALIAIACFH